MTTTIKLEGNPRIFYNAINIENKTFPPPGKIQSEMGIDVLSIKILGKMTVGRMKFTIDELLQSILLAGGISEVLGYE